MGHIYDASQESDDIFHNIDLDHPSLEEMAQLRRLGIVKKQK